jgi:hypothetical protein
MNDYLITGIVLFSIGLVALVIGLIYKGYSNEIEESENWKRVVFYLGIIFIGFSIFFLIFGATRKNDKSFYQIV